MGAESPALRVDDVSAGYRGRRVLDGVTFDVAPGEIVGLIGLNGAGKTTLLKGILDLHFLDGGHIEIFGVSHTVPRSRQGLAFLPEQIMPSPVLKGREWLRLTLAPYGVVWDRDKAEALCSGLALDPTALDRRVATYSKGMAQKLGLLGTFLSERPLMLLDEPMSGLDPLARRRLKEHLLRCREAGRAVFFSSHILADVAALCDRLAVLHGGRLMFLGTPAALRAMFGRAELEDAFLDAIGGGESDRAVA